MKNRSYSLIALLIVLVAMCLCLSSCKGTTKNSILGFSLKDTFIDDNPILQASYAEILERFGQPQSVATNEVSFSDHRDEPYTLYTASYNDVQFELLSNTNDPSMLDDEPVFQFDITGTKYSFIGLTVGMSADEVQSLYRDIVFYDMNVVNLSTEQIEKDYPNDAFVLCSIKAILTKLKPENMYSGFTQIAYVPGIVTEDELSQYDWQITTSLGAVLLFSDDNLKQIAFGMPTAG